MLNKKKFLQDYLISQGVGPTDWEEIIHPTEALEHDPFLIKDSREWLNALYNHRDDVITIVGDYDADGVLSAATMRKGLQILGVGAKLNTYVPTRMDGYGITPVSVGRIQEQFPDTQTIVTTDNGVAAFEGVQAAKDNGWTVLVTDHHLAKDEGLPVADAIVDINRPGDTYPFKGISGTAMAYKMVLAYAMTMAPNYVPMIQQLRTLVGISSVTDMMTMRDENRYWCKYALDEVQQAVDGISTPHADPHIAMLIQAIKASGGIYDKNVDDTMFGFTIGPMLNAPSRVTGTPQEAYDYFMENDPDEMMTKALHLIATNNHRKEVIGDVGAKVLADLQQRIDGGEALYAIASRVPLTQGFVGLVAGRINQKFGTPAVTFSSVNFDGEVLDGPDDAIHGSARSPEGLSIVAIMQEMKNRDDDIILGFGGHAAAAGLSIKNGRYEDFCKMFNEVTKEFIDQMPVAEETTHYAPGTFVIEPDDVTIDLYLTIQQMMPFGQGFVRPQFVLEGVDTSHPLFMGDHDQHIKFAIFKPKLDLIRWNATDDFDHMGSPKTLDLIGSIKLSSMGRTSAQFMIDEWIA